MGRKFQGMNKGDGGHTLITDKLIEDVCKWLRKGAYVETACASVGINPDTFKDWLRKAARYPADYPLCVKFSGAVNRAMAEAENNDLERVDKKADEDWRAAAWKLERRNPRRWGSLERHELSGPQGGPIAFSDLTDEELEARIEELKDEYEKTKGKKK